MFLNVCRTCRYSLFCANTVIREEAYCYTENSPCEKWYTRHKLPSKYIQANSGSSAVGTNISIAHKTEVLSNGQKVILDPQKNNVGNNSPVTLTNPNILNLQIGGKGRVFDPFTENKINSNSVVDNQDENRAFDLSYFKIDKNSNNINKKDKHDGYTSGSLPNIKTPIYYQPNFNNFQQTFRHNWTQSSKLSNNFVLRLSIILKTEYI